MGEVEKIYEKCPTCGAHCVVKPNEYEPTIGHISCDCGISSTIDLELNNL